MTTQITVMSTNPQPNGDTEYVCVGWFTAPSNNVVPTPGLVSAVSWIDAPTMRALRAGTLVERVFSTGIIASGTAISDVKAAILAKYAEAQSALTSLNPSIAAIGATYDGSSWSAWSGAPANLLTSPRATDGRSTVRTSVSALLLRPSIRLFSMKPGTSAIVNWMYAGQAAGDATATFYDVNGAVTALSSAAVKTVVDLEPTYDQELAGGGVITPAATLAAAQYYFSVTALPDVSLGNGGSVPLLSPVDLSLVPGNRFEFDLGQTVYLPYSASQHTGKIRFTFTHPVSNNNAFQWYVRTYA